MSSETIAPATIRLADLGPEEFRSIADALYRATGVMLPPRKRLMVQSRLLKRLREHNLSDFRSYLLLLQKDPLERQAAIDVLTTHETSFFRDPAHFKLLGQYSRKEIGPIRSWSAACSTGEEACSMAMVFADSGKPWSILATDVSESSLATARRAEYPMPASRSIPAEFLKKFCLRGVGPRMGFFRVDRKLMGHILFKQLNLLDPVATEPMHFIFLRNVLIYFDERSRQTALRHVIRSLAPQGLLFLGTAESLRYDSFQMEHINPGVYRKRD